MHFRHFGGISIIGIHKKIAQRFAFASTPRKLRQNFLPDFPFSRAFPEFDRVSLLKTILQTAASQCIVIIDFAGKDAFI